MSGQCLQGHAIPFPFSMPLYLLLNIRDLKALALKGGTKTVDEPGSRFIQGIHQFP